MFYYKRIYFCKVNVVMVNNKLVLGKVGYNNWFKGREIGWLGMYGEEYFGEGFSYFWLWCSEIECAGIGK